MSREDKGQILRQVYEDNRRISGALGRGPDPRPAGIPWRSLIGGMLFLVLVAISWFQLGARSNDEKQAFDAGLDVPRDNLDTKGADGVGDLSGLTASGVPLAELFDLSVRKVVIDAGHGGVDGGASGKGGLLEKDITLDVAARLARRLRSNHGLSIEMTRSSDSTLSLRDRVEFSNGHDADLFVSIHVNYFPSEPVYALETYYFGSQTDDAALRVAERENRNSEYSVAEFNRMIESLGDHVKLQESERLARAVQTSMFRNTRAMNSEVRNWGVKSAPFVVLVGSKSPSILAEIGVISNGDEEALLATSEYREQLALFLEEGIVNYLRSLEEVPPSS